MLKKIIDWYVSSKSPLAVRIKQFVRRHAAIRGLGIGVIFVLLRPGRALTRLVQIVFPSRLSHAASARAAKVQRLQIALPTNGQRQFHIVALNDVGFQFGAGIALRRQVASFLLNNWKVTAVSHSRWVSPRYPAITGSRELDKTVPTHMALASSDGTPADIVEIIRGLCPDLVVAGNLHGTGQAAAILAALKAEGVPTVAYMHDCYWVTGRCAYVEGCGKFVTGCNDTCPTPQEYPALVPRLIDAAWRERATLFTGAHPIPLVANSNWTKAIAQKRFEGAARLDLIHLGVDHRLFSPIDRREARGVLGLPQDKFIVAMGAIDLNSRWKGGSIFSALYKSLSRRHDVGVILLGSGSSSIKSLKSFGLIEDERIIPYILSAADLFVSTAIEESFGQMLLEASACGIPSIAFDVGGIGDIINSETGLLVREKSAKALEGAINTMLGNTALSVSMGKAARLRVEKNFTLKHQAEAWVNYVAHRM